MPTYAAENLDGRIELLWSKPDFAGQFPCLLFVHGHQENLQGAVLHSNFLKNQRLINKWKVVIASVSMPGYGKSLGPADYCGIKTQSAIITAIDFLRSKPNVLTEKIALIGYSRGAIAASMVATKDQRLAALVLGAGFYDFKQYFQDAPQGIKNAITRECGTNESMFNERSALKHVTSIKSPVLIFHGLQDERKGEAQARRLFEKLQSQKIPAKINIYKQYGHNIPFKIFYKETKIFLTNYLIESSNNTQQKDLLLN
ncbi:MAG: prolyl oligopeptidase family serine peptidase [Halobacteriovoraceae bacterium]|jgi:dipeptidyl aminopeptidase/acylaminoacyl peptidase|nr:prolyl oligopeptidase family serine peptidase [Halobacteriovoraceae bacterium]